jgi:hypothetical protein
MSKINRQFPTETMDAKETHEKMRASLVNKQMQLKIKFELLKLRKLMIQSAK